MAAYCSWSTLPSIIIVEILSYLSLTDRLNASATCKRWRGCLIYPSLWKSVSFRVKQGSRRRTKHLADVCGRFVREAVLEFHGQVASNVRESLRILEIFADNGNLEKLTLQPDSCQIEWRQRVPGETVNQYIDALDCIAQNARQLKHLSLGCIGELADSADHLLPILAAHQANSLEILHVSSVKEDPDSYGLIEFPVSHFVAFHHLRVLGMDYDYLTNALLLSFVQPRRASLEKLVLHVHGIELDRENITNSTWKQVVRANPQLEVTLNLIHSIDGAAGLLELLQPAMPVAHLRMFFCQHLNMAGIDFLTRHCCSTLRSIHIIDGIIDDRPNVYEADTDEDPFVMLAWKCPNLHKFTLIGYEICRDDVIAIARLRGAQLKTLELPYSCISTIEEEDDSLLVSFGNIGPEFNEEVSRNLGQDWAPINDRDLHPAVTDPRADAETAYLGLLLQDQVY